MLRLVSVLVKKGGAPKTRLLLLHFLVVLVVLGSVIEVRVRLLP